jgi:hypothetical protein
MTLDTCADLSLAAGTVALPRLGLLCLYSRPLMLLDTLVRTSGIPPLVDFFSVQCRALLQLH